MNLNKKKKKILFSRMNVDAVVFCFDNICVVTIKVFDGYLGEEKKQLNIILVQIIKLILISLIFDLINQHLQSNFLISIETFDNIKI